MYGAIINFVSFPTARGEAHLEKPSTNDLTYAASYRIMSIEKVLSVNGQPLVKIG